MKPTANERPKMSTTYDNYTVYISSEPSYYGSDCTQEDANRIVKNLGDLIRSEFPGIDINEYRDGGRSSKTTGPDEAVVETINRWIEENWTAAL